MASQVFKTPHPFEQLRAPARGNLPKEVGKRRSEWGAFQVSIFDISSRFGKESQSLSVCLCFFRERDSLEFERGTGFFCVKKPRECMKNQSAGTYDRPSGGAKETLAPSMDICISSNFERFVYLKGGVQRHEFSYFPELPKVLKKTIEPRVTMEEAPYNPP